MLRQIIFLFRLASIVFPAASPGGEIEDWTNPCNSSDPPPSDLFYPDSAFLVIILLGNRAEGIQGYLVYHNVHVEPWHKNHPLLGGHPATRLGAYFHFPPA